MIWARKIREQEIVEVGVESGPRVGTRIESAREGRGENVPHGRQRPRYPYEAR